MLAGRKRSRRGCSVDHGGGDNPPEGLAGVPAPHKPTPALVAGAAKGWLEDRGDEYPIY